MKIAFYAPLKPPHHPVPSGDRLMARQIIAALGVSGHKVQLASELRAYLNDPADAPGLARLTDAAAREVARLAEAWCRVGAPDLWFCYHPYYKSPDLIGPALCTTFGLPYVTLEASYSARRNIGIWAGMQAQVLEALGQAAVNIHLTARDERGLRAVLPGGRLARLKPFISDDTFARVTPRPEPGHLVCVGMMRPGTKLDSYTRLAAGLSHIADLPWRLSVIGDGPLRAQIRALFASFAPERITWHGLLDTDAIAAVFARASILAWPGANEAYGLAYLEAQAAGLPVVAWDNAGVPEVVADGETGLLTPPDDDAAYGRGLARLMGDEALRARLGAGARARVLRDHTFESARITLERILSGVARSASAAGP